MESIVCNGIGKIYGKKQVLKNINLTLEKGKIYGLIGRNGAGKTTLLSIMSAQNPASEGTVTWNGENVWENRKALDHICFSRELSINLYGSGVSGMKVKDYLKTASYYYPNWDQALAEELIKKFELNTKQRINKMSKGMLSMVTIIVALASKADFTFMDEPVAGLDVVMRDYFYHKLMEEYTETGRTFVISTHIIEEATDLMEEVVMIKNGEVLLKENTQELLERSYHVSGLAEAVDQATENAKLNGLENMVSFRCADVFELLPELEAQGEKYDVVILDPPAFTKSRNSIKNAVKGYREINLRGLKLVKDGGFLVTCSCSHFMDPELFAKTIREASHGAHKRLRQVEFKTQGPDHPILWAADESYYLKFYIFQVVDER